MKVSEEKKLEDLESFVISSKMTSLAKENAKNNIFLDAGRGNPNWINKKARLAFNRLVEFGIIESERTINKGDMAGYTEQHGMRQRFEAFLRPEEYKIDDFWLSVLDYIRDDMKLNQDEVIKEFVDGAIGNNYPLPARCLRNTEKIINQYLQTTLYNGVDLKDETSVFTTEGGTAAIVYIFNTLRENKLIHYGDKIAINTPIFTPYIEIPTLNDYQMVEVDLNSDASNNWEIAPGEIDKLLDPSIKLFVVVNPSNPGSKAFSQKDLAEIKEVIKKRPDLMIVTDDVYGTFVENFQTLYSVVPNNTLLVYSFSKLFGATGWRLGLVAAHDQNVFDKIISELPDKDKKELEKRYGSVEFDPSKMKFIDRLVADSRSISLYHTAGLSTPQQIMEDLFSLTHLVNKNQTDSYIETSKRIVGKRYTDLHDSLNYPKDESGDNSKYYSIIDIYNVAERKYGKDFRNYLENNFEQLDFLVNLAQKNGVVLMDGVGFGTHPGCLRVSQANLPTEDYRLIGNQVMQLLADYHKQFIEHKVKTSNEFMAPKN
ncbi:bifunctional aspartate transaminase/aspartate 4-decarboxylase [Companilactobacillus kedongensis]|uniref:bifunctional aspartate transaminase/aspartate 4-decarboxylase n=1 Tax=Companilactobacillus kedongensis TaxID=2486004 RepID=UPI000F795A2B|nr:bifunctional aspartate transaminase/aspartate 4-decarboxylase [Companilactobacillus kedongensis]